MTNPDEINPIGDFTNDWPGYLDALEPDPVDFGDEDLVKIQRLRLLGGDGGPLEVSYAMGEVKDGSQVRVNLPERDFPNRGVRGALRRMCEEAGRTDLTDSVLRGLSIQR